MAEQGTNIAECIATLLAHGPSDDVCEQVIIAHNYVYSIHTYRHCVC